VVWVAIAVGGALGAIARHALNVLVQGRYRTFPVGIFIVNAIGCFAIGILAGAMASGRLQVPEPVRLFMVAGLLGGFTTFSAYGLDTFILIRAGHTGLAVANGLGQLMVGVAAVWAGFTLACWRG
jgi:CrcB protein